MHGLGRVFQRGGIGCTFIKGHDDIGPQLVLDAHGFLRANKMRRTRFRVFKPNPIVLNVTQFGQAKHLKTTRIGENRLLSVHPAMQATGFFHQVGARA